MSSRLKDSMLPDLEDVVLNQIEATVTKEQMLELSTKLEFKEFIISK